MQLGLEQGLGVGERELQVAEDLHADHAVEADPAGQEHLDDAGPMFEAELHSLAAVLGVADAYAELERA